MRRTNGCTHTHARTHRHTGFDELQKLDSKFTAAHGEVATHVHGFVPCARMHVLAESRDRQDRSKATPGGNLNFKTRDQSLGAEIIISHARSQPRLG